MLFFRFHYFGKAEIAAEAEAEVLRRKARGEADALYAKMEAEARGSVLHAFLPIPLFRTDPFPEAREAPFPPA